MSSYIPRNIGRETLIPSSSSSSRVSAVEGSSQGTRWPPNASHIPANRIVLVRFPRRTRPPRAIRPVAVMWITRDQRVPQISILLAGARPRNESAVPQSPPKDSWDRYPLGGCMEAVAPEIAERVRAAASVRIVTHIATDGITGGAIASEALARAGISHEVAFVKKLDETVLTELKRAGTPLVWFIDLGAGMLHALHGLDAVVTDHHVPTERCVPKALRGDLIRFAESQDRVLMLNPHLEGEGSDVASGAGCAYAVARALDGRNADLAAIAIVGAVGDVQDQEFRRLSRYNRGILADGVAAGVVKAEIDLRLFGRETRPAYKMLQYATDPWIPRLSGNEEACIAFLLELGVDLKVEDHWRSWSDLDRGEKQRVVSALVSHMLERGCGIKEVERLGSPRAWPSTAKARARTCRSSRSPKPKTASRSRRERRESSWPADSTSRPSCRPRAWPWEAKAAVTTAPPARRFLRGPKKSFWRLRTGWSGSSWGGPDLIPPIETEALPKGAGLDRFAFNGPVQA